MDVETLTHAVDLIRQQATSDAEAEHAVEAMLDQMGEETGK
jgi:hypothetical protein